MKKSTIMPTNLLDMVQLIDEDEVSSEMGEAFASFMLNPTVTWAKFILTDDRKNANNQRVPKEEFSNLIRSGVHMPVKMALGEIAQGHKDSKPLGVITHLKETSMPDGTSAIIALAALWGEERPADVGFIKDRFSNGQPVNVSWEILFSEANFNVEQNSEDLLGTALKAATIVGEPAYEGRTQFLSVAAKKWSKAYIASLPESSFLYINREGERYLPIKDLDGKVDRTKLTEAMTSLPEIGLPGNIFKEKKAILQDLIDRFEAGASVDEVSIEFGDSNPLAEEMMNIEQLQAEVTRLLAELETAKASVTERDATITTLTKEKETFETELTELRTYKQGIEAEAAKVAKLAEVKNKFVEAGIEKDDEYWTANSDKLIAMSEDQLAFVVQEVKAALAAKTETNTSNASKKKVPNLNGDADESEGEITISQMADYLRKNRGKK